VTVDDVQRAATSTPIPLEGLPSQVAGERGLSRGTTTQGSLVTTVVEVDLTAVTSLVARSGSDVAGRLGTRLTTTAFVARAVVEALKAHPRLNSAIDPDGAVLARSRQDLLVTVTTGAAPVVHRLDDAGDLNLLGLARRLGAPAATSPGPASATPSSSGVDAGAFSLTDTGADGALWTTPLPVTGGVAALSAGAVVDRPVVLTRAFDEKVIAIRAMCHIALTYDVGVVDAGDATSFLRSVKDRLEAGQFDTELT
jgi:pyruvate dehydrogenase E2 component (dihydrolipoamide acetyltransferase)